MVRNGVPRWKIKRGNKNFDHDPLGHGGLKTREPGRRRDQIFSKWQQNNCVSSVWTVLHDTLLVPRILRWLLLFFKKKNLCTSALGLILLHYFPPTLRFLSIFRYSWWEATLTKFRSRESNSGKVNVWDIVMENGVPRGVLHRFKYRCGDFPKI